MTQAINILCGGFLSALLLLQAPQQCSTNEKKSEASPQTVTVEQKADSTIVIEARADSIKYPVKTDSLVVIELKPGKTNNKLKVRIVLNNAALEVTKTQSASAKIILESDRGFYAVPIDSVFATKYDASELIGELRRKRINASIEKVRDGYGVLVGPFFCKEQAQSIRDQLRERNYERASVIPL